jgi:thioredoxin reductase (NADPH)
VFQSLRTDQYANDSSSAFRRDHEQSDRFGAEPHTEWLAGVLCLDERGFILTGRDIPSTNWVLEREPYPFETSRPGVFAAGDVRTGSVKRVAGAVGEGSVAVGSVHRYLAELEPLVGQA